MNLVLKNIVILLLLGDIEYVIKEKKEKINAQVIDKNMHICIDEFRLGLSWALAQPKYLRLDYGVTIAIGILVSTIMLASYLCVYVKGVPCRYHHSSLPTTTVVALDVAATATVVTSVVGLKRAAIEAFYPRLTYEMGGTGPSELCSICLAEYEAGEALRRALDCNHYFHLACVDEWRRVSAPALLQLIGVIHGLYVGLHPTL